MIRDVVRSKGTAAVTSDHWRLVRARYADPTGRHPFVREFVSEHGDRAECGKAAKLLRPPRGPA